MGWEAWAIRCSCSSAEVCLRVGWTWFVGLWVKFGDLGEQRMKRMNQRWGKRVGRIGSAKARVMPFSARMVLGIMMMAFVLTAEASWAQTMYREELIVTHIQPTRQDRCDNVNHYVRLTIDGVTQTLDPDVHTDGNAGFDCIFLAPRPYWDFYVIQPAEHFLEHSECTHAKLDMDAELRLQLFEEDNGPDDVGIDLTFRRADLAVDASTPGVLTSTRCEGTDENGGLCFTYRLELAPDTDGDGFTDQEELAGVDINCDGVMTPGVDLFLHQMGLDPNVKDVLVEINHFPGFEVTADAIGGVKNIFKRAPETAGGVLTPGRGINLLVDAGAIYSDFPATETIGGRDVSIAPSFDKVGCDQWAASEGDVNEIDPNAVPRSKADARGLMCHHDSPNRKGYFRKIVMGPSLVEANTVAGVYLNNDQIYVANQDGWGDQTVVLAHELGHALALDHGGGRLVLEGGSAIFGNCEPNHYSIMNYLYGTRYKYEYIDADGNVESHSIGGGLPFWEVGAFRALRDFAPSKVPDTYEAPDGSSPSGWREVAIEVPEGCTLGNCNPRLPVLPDLNEACLIDGAFLQHDLPNGVFYRQAFLRPASATAAHATLDYLTSPIDWSGDGYDPSVCSAVELDSPSWTPACSSNSTALSVLSSFDEWTGMILPCSRGGAAASMEFPEYFDDEIPPVEPTDLSFAFTTDLRVSAQLGGESVEVGKTTLLKVTVGNEGPGLPNEGEVRVTLPDGVEFLSAPTRCVQETPSTQLCRTVTSNQIHPLPVNEAMVLDFELLLGKNESGQPRFVLVDAQHKGQEVHHTDNHVAVPLLSSPGFLSFEDSDRPWVKSHSNGSIAADTTTEPTSSGERALALGCGYGAVDSPSFDTAELEQIGDELLVDVYVPQNLAGWIGELKLFVDVPSANLWNRWVGQSMLGNLPRNQWMTVTFHLADDILDVLLSDFPDARIRFESNITGCSPPVVIDSLRFGGTFFERTEYHVMPGEEEITSSSVFTFDDVDSWHSEQVQLFQSNDVTQGSGSVTFPSESWVRLVSSEFNTNDLVGVSDRIGFDIYIPDLPPDYYWFGQLNVFFTCPTANLHNAYVGHQPLQVLFDDEFNRVVFDLPSHVADVLQTENQLCRAALDFSFNPSFGSVIVDNGGFVQ